MEVTDVIWVHAKEIYAHGQYTVKLFLSIMLLVSKFDPH